MSVLNDALDKYPHPEIFNTDQGSQYTSEAHTQRLKNLGITISMDGKGRATDNICIEFYNHRRFHETLDYKKPMDVYQESIKLNQKKKKAS
jgi:putative transposase